MGSFVSCDFVDHNDGKYKFSHGINHGGFFLGIGRSYCNGTLVWYGFLDEQTWSMNDLKTLVEDLGYEMARRMYVFFSAVDKPVGSVLSLLKTEDSFRNMLHWVGGFGAQIIASTH
jgi:hypothetical protein